VIEIVGDCDVMQSFECSNAQSLPPQVNDAITRVVKSILKLRAKTSVCDGCIFLHDEKLFNLHIRRTRQFILDIRDSSREGDTSTENF